MFNVCAVQFKDINDEYGHLTPIEGGQDLPFEIKRVYYITRVGPDVRRGFHSHKMLHQVLICVSGSVKILTKTPVEEQITELCLPQEGLYIGPMVWREMYDFSPGAALLVLASEHYDVSDYIRDYPTYISQAKEYFRLEG